MIKIPESYSYAEAYLTLRCNFGCPYCINAHTGVKRKRDELTAREWVLALNNVDFGNIPLTMGGGEPTFHQGFFEIMDGLKPEIHVDLLTNGSFDCAQFSERIPPRRFTQGRERSYKSIRFSYHVGITDPDGLIEKVAYLQEKGYSVGIFSLNHPENLRANIAMTEKCRAAGVFFFIRDFLGFYNDKLFGNYKYPTGLNGNRKNCRCKIEELLIGPDGKIYRCHKDLYDGAGEVGDLLNIACEVRHEFRPCDNYGLCSPCDLKDKSAPDLTGRKCSVEVIHG